MLRQNPQMVTTKAFGGTSRVQLNKQPLVRYGGVRLGFSDGEG